VGFIYTLTVGSVFLLAFLTLTNPRKVNAKANQWLGLFLLGFACLLLDRVLPATGIYTAHPHLLGLTELTRFTMAPALYLSVVCFTSPERRGRTKDWLHFLPGALFLLHLLPFLLQTGTAKQAVLQGHFPARSPFDELLGSVVFYAVKIQVVGYWVASYRKLVRHQQNVQLFASQLGRIDLNWLKLFLWGLAFLVFLWFNELFFHVERLLALTPWLFFAAVYALSYFSLRQPEVFDFSPPEVAEINHLLQQQTSEKKPATPRIAPERLPSLKDQLAQLMHREKVYLEADLGLPSLALRMNLSSHELSYLLNEGFGKNFFQFVNEYRIEEAKRLLLSPQHHHLNMLGVAYEAGFSSKTTFNTTFKRLVGLSPSQFVQTHCS